MSIGLNSNNPWNLQASHVAWLGLTPNQTESGELCFDTMVDGIRAGVKLCYTYQGRGLNTPGSFITEFSPAAAGNPTAAYIRNVCQWTGYDQNQALDFHDASTMLTWAPAIFRQEQGADSATITTEQLLEGIEAANG